MRIYQQRHARMFKRLRCRRATIGYYSVFERSVGRFAVHENASKYKIRASVLIQSEPIRLYVGPVSSSAKADDPVPRGGLSGNQRHLLIPPPRNAQAGWHVVSESERRVGWGCKKRSPPWPRFASAFPPHCSLTLAGEGWERPARRHGVLDAPPSRGMTACFV